MRRQEKWGVVSYVLSSRKGFQDLADRLARVLNAWLSWEPEHTKSRQACGAPDGEHVLTDSKPYSHFITEADIQQYKQRQDHGDSCLVS